MLPSNNNSGRNSPTNSSDHGHDHNHSDPGVNQPDIENIIDEYIDTSGNVTISYDVSGSVTYVSHIQDISTNNVFSATCEDNTDIPVPVIIASDLSSSTIYGPGYDITNESGKAEDGSYIIRQTFTSSTDPSNNDVNINANFTEIVTTYVDASNNNAADILLNQIKLYAAEINCSDFHGKGSIDDYTNLFNAASRIANETKQMHLDIDVEGFEDFGKAADELSELFNGFIIKLHQVNIIDDYAFLSSIASALSKIVNLSNVFGRFKETILATSTVQIPKSAHTTSVLIHNVSSQIDCAMKYINHFVDSNSPAPATADLSAEEKGIINAAVSTIDSWNTLCEQGVSIAMANDPDIQCINTVNQKLKQTTQTLSNATSLLKSKLSAFNLKSN
jgi:hypothetical protein